MSFLSKRLSTIKPSPTLSLTKKAADLRAQGRDIISLGAGEPDFGTPDWIKQAAFKAMQDEKTKYTPVSGTASLKKSIQDKFSADHGLVYQENEVIACTGGKQVIFNAFLATLNPGDEVLIPAPYWVSYPDIVTLAEGKSVIISCDEGEGFKLTPEKLQNAITPKTKWLILNSPSNPTGAVYSEEELLSLARVLEKNPHVWVLSDDIYEHILYTGQPFKTIAQVASFLKERTLTLNGVSKAYAMTGWRLGYAGGPKDLIAAMSKLQSQSTSNPCSISQEAAKAALEGDQTFLQERRDFFKERRDEVVALLNDIDGISCSTPEGAFYLYPSCRDLIGRATPQGKILENDADVCDYFLEEADVAVVPGSAFGLSPYFRISYATDLETLRTACQRLKKAVETLAEQSYALRG